MASPNRESQSEELIRILAAGTGCLCLIILVAGTMWGVDTGRISKDVLGQVSMAGVAGGVLGLALILFWIIRLSIQGKEYVQHTPAFSPKEANKKSDS